MVTKLVKSRWFLFGPVAHKLVIAEQYPYNGILRKYYTIFLIMGQIKIADIQWLLKTWQHCNNNYYNNKNNDDNNNYYYNDEYSANTPSCSQQLRIPCFGSPRSSWPSSFVFFPCNNLTSELTETPWLCLGSDLDTFVSRYLWLGSSWLQIFLGSHFGLLQLRSPPHGSGSSYTLQLHLSLQILFQAHRNHKAAY